MEAPFARPPNLPRIDGSGGAELDAVGSHPTTAGAGAGQAAREIRAARGLLQAAQG